MIDKSVMADFPFQPHHDGTLVMRHTPCRMQIGSSDLANLYEAYEAAENHLLDLCPGSHSIE